MTRSWSDEEIQQALFEAREHDKWSGERPPDPTCAPITPRGEEVREVNAARANDHLRTGPVLASGTNVRGLRIGKLPPVDPWPPGGERVCTLCRRELRESSFGRVGYGYVIPYGGGVGRVVCTMVRDETGRRIDCEWKLAEEARRRRTDDSRRAKGRAQGDRQAGQVRRLRRGGREWQDDIGKEDGER